MSATPLRTQAVWITVGHGEPGEPMIVLKADAFAALVAVARGFDKGWNAGVVELEKLDAAHPGWRDWS